MTSNDSPKFLHLFTFVNFFYIRITYVQVTAVVRLRDKHQEAEYSEYQFLRNEFVFSDLDWCEGLTPSADTLRRFFTVTIVAPAKP